MKRIGPSWIIHLFALLHAAVAFGCRMGGVDDELLLTVLTMAMALIICRRQGLTIEFTAAIIIVANILGFLLGSLGANIIRTFITTDTAVNAMSTALTTETLGWGITATAKLSRHDAASNGNKTLSSAYLKWILLVAGGIFALRLLIVFLFQHNDFNTESVYGMTRKVLSNSVALSILICLNILYVRKRKRNKHRTSELQKHLNFALFMLCATLVETALVGLGLPFNVSKNFMQDFALTFVVSFMAQVTVYCIVYMANYAITAGNEIQVEREKTNMAQYRYLKLKRQVNPHFLFNSLNILDYLICEEKKEKASTYTHKLAGIYRYMIKSEDEEIVPLRDELVFVKLYVDLLKVRFPEGFEVIVDVPEETKSRFIPPCSIQLLIENATKHNAVTPDNPLVIKVEASGDMLRVSNNIIHKVSKTPSTGLGQQYIRQLYMDISGKSIDIDMKEDNYCVTLPLL